MASICSCTGSISNMGVPGCLEGIDAALYPIFIPTLKTDGTANGIDSAGNLSTLLTAALQNEVAADRWLPLTGIKNFLSEPADATTEDFDDGTFVLLADGSISVSFIVPVEDPYKLKAKVDSMRCKSTSFMLVDRSGNLVGEASGTDLIGRKIQNNSISTKVLPKNDSQTNKLEIMFVIDKASNDRKVDFIESASIVGYDLTSTLGLQDVNTTSLTPLTATTATWIAALDFGGMGSRIAAGGLTGSEVEPYNVNTSSAVTVTTVESPIGTYALTFVAQTASDVIYMRGVAGATIQLSYDLKDIVTPTAVAI